MGTGTAKKDFGFISMLFSVIILCYLYHFGPVMNLFATTIKTSVLRANSLPHGCAEHNAGDLSVDNTCSVRYM